MEMFRHGLVALKDWPAALAEAISNGDVPRQERAMLYATLNRLRREGLNVFDGDAARTAYAELPELVTIYRGTVGAEADEKAYGICWTLDKSKAEWFATEHGRFKNRSSPPVLLTTTVKREDISGLLFDRDEQAVLMYPHLFGRIEVTLLAETTVA